MHLLTKRSLSCIFVKGIIKSGEMYGLRQYLFVLALVWTQSLYSSGTYRRYDVTTGLSENSVLDIVQDSKGYMWFATKDGLNKFNGNSFINYRAEQESNVLNIERLCLHADSVRIWVASTRTLYLFDPRTEEFTAFDRPGIHILCMRYDDSGNLWMGARDKVFRWDASHDSLRAYDIRTERSESNFVRTIFKDARGTIWIGTQDGLRQYKGRDRLSESYRPYPADRDPQANEISALSGKSESELWVGTRNGHFASFAIKSRQFTYYPTEFELGRIHEIFDYSERELLVGSDNGLFYFDRYSHRWRRSGDELGRESIYDCFRDREGGLWIGTYFSGVNYLSPKHGEIEWYHDDKTPGSLSGNAVSQFCEDPSGNMWIATENGGLNYFDTKSRRFTSYADRSYTNLHALYLEGDDLWIGTFSRGLDILNVRTGRIRRYRMDLSDSTSLPNDHVYTICRTRDGTMYVGTLGGLCRYDPAGDHFLRERALGQSFVFDMAEDSEGNLWVATKGRGLWRRRPAGAWQQLRTSGSQSERFNRIYIDEDSTVWICSEDRGIYRYDRSGDSLVNYSSQQHLPRCTYYGIIDDGNGSLWLSSNSGIVRYRPDSMTVQTYTIENGLQSNQFNYKSSMKSSDGKFWFGGINGFNCFYPQDLTVNTVLPNVEISSVTMPLSDTLDASRRIMVGSRISIPHATPYFTINFESLSFVAPGQNLYAWKIQELHREWNYTRSPNVSLTGLSAGRYHFLVKGSNNDGYWSERVAELEVTVEPAPLLTVWAKLLYGVLGVMILWILFRRWNRIETERKKQELTRQKMEFFTQVAHEIKTSVTLISAPLERIVRDRGAEAGEDSNLSVMKKNVDRLLDLVRQFLDFRKIDKNGYSLTFSRTDMRGLVETVLERFRGLNQDITVESDLPDGPMDYNVNPEAMVKILSNLLSNAYRYARKRITVRLSPDRHKGGFVLSVQDDGDGIRPEFRERIFEPFYQASPVAGNGFGIGLSVVRLLSEKHGGTVRVNRQYTDGCEMDVYIPSIAGRTEHPDPVMSCEDRDSERHHEWSILLVEDREDLRKYLASELSDTYDVYTAGNGSEALRLLGERTVDLIISDIMMPEMDGFGLLAAIRGNEELSYLPFILLSALDTVESKIRGLDGGADAYIEKPFTINHLRATVSNLFAGRKRIFHHFATDPEFRYDRGGMKATETEWLERVDGIIRSNLTNEAFSIDMLAEEMAVSRSVLHRRIKGITGTTPNDYIKIFRLKTAATMLREGQYRVNEICDLVGFYNRSYFAKCFYEQFGIHPKDYPKGQVTRSR